MELRGVRYLIIALTLLLPSMTYVLYDCHQKNLECSRNNTELMNQNLILLTRVQDLGEKISLISKGDYGQTAVRNADATCAEVNIDSNSAMFNTSGDNKLLLKLKNAGTRNAIISTIRVTGENLNSTVYSHPASFTGTLNSGDEILVGLAINTTWIDSIATIRVIPADCPQSAISIKGSEILIFR